MLSSRAPPNNACQAHLDKGIGHGKRLQEPPGTAKEVAPSSFLRTATAAAPSANSTDSTTGNTRVSFASLIIQNSLIHTRCLFSDETRLGHKSGPKAVVHLQRAIHQYPATTQDWRHSWHHSCASQSYDVLKEKFGGAEGDRTPDLVIANDALSQLSYCPAPAAHVAQPLRIVKRMPAGTAQNLSPASPV